MGIYFSTVRIEHPQQAPIPVGGTIISIPYRNAVTLLDALAICANVERDSMEIDRFSLIARNWQQEHTKATEVIRTTIRGDGANVINIEATAGHINQQLTQILEMMTEAQPLGATHLYWWQWWTP